MKKIVLKLYEFDELSKDSQERIIEREHWNVMEQCMDAYGIDYKKSMKAFEDMTDTRVYNWEVGYERYDFSYILGTRKTGCDLLILGGTNCDESYLDGVFGCLGNEKFYVCQPISLYKTTRNIHERPALYAFKIATEYFRAHGMVPVFENSHCKLMRL